jgi:putative multiple sugar transport system permease protein
MENKRSNPYFLSDLLSLVVGIVLLITLLFIPLVQLPASSVFVGETAFEIPGSVRNAPTMDAVWEGVYNSIDNNEELSTIAETEGITVVVDWETLSEVTGSDINSTNGSRAFSSTLVLGGQILATGDIFLVVMLLASFAVGIGAMFNLTGNGNRDLISRIIALAGLVIAVALVVFLVTTQGLITSRAPDAFASGSLFTMIGLGAWLGLVGAIYCIVQVVPSTQSFLARYEDVPFLLHSAESLRSNIREYGMFIALLVITVIFSLTTDGLFISSQNLSNLFNQTGYIAVLGVGMTLIIVIRHIDLSVGFLSGFLGAIAAIGLQQWDLPVYIVIPMVLLFGTFAGLISGFLVAQMKIPAFVATLAGFLAYRGGILLLTESTGTIIIDDDVYNAIGNGFIPDIRIFGSFLPEMHHLTLVIGLLGLAFFIIGNIRDRRKKLAYNFEVSTMDMFILKLVLVSVLVGWITWQLAAYNGLSWTLVIVLLIVFVYDFITNRTVIGRHIYAVGGNPEAAELSGINVKRITYIVFGSMGMLSALSGILFSSRLQSATTTAGTLFELDAIAAAFVGGVSAAGGVGKVTGALIGALVMISLTSGMNLMGIGIAQQYVVRGGVLAAAVIFDVATRNRRG